MSARQQMWKMLRPYVRYMNPAEIEQLRKNIDIDAAALERLAELEHEKWMSWTRYILDNISPENVRRWRSQIETPYDELSEQEKESDRVWARKALLIIKDVI